MITVQKFGGTSVADPERIREVAEHAVRTKRRGTDVVLVVSAMGKETDELLRLADDVSTSQPGREMDMLITAGERKAMALVAMAICDLGEPAQSFTGSQAGFITDTNHKDAKILELRPERIAEALRRRRHPRHRRQPGRVHRARRHVPRPGRLRHHRRRHRPRPRRRVLRALHRRGRACTPPTPASCPRPVACPRSASTSCSR